MTSTARFAGYMDSCNAPIQGFTARESLLIKSAMRKMAFDHDDPRYRNAPAITADEQAAHDEFSRRREAGIIADRNVPQVHVPIDYSTLRKLFEGYDGDEEFVDPLPRLHAYSETLPPTWQRRPDVERPMGTEQYPCRRGCGRVITHAGARAMHEKACKGMLSPTDHPSPKYEPVKVSGSTGLGYSDPSPHAAKRAVVEGESPNAAVYDQEPESLKVGIVKCAFKGLQGKSVRIVHRGDQRGFSIGQDFRVEYLDVNGKWVAFQGAIKRADVRIQVDDPTVIAIEFYDMKPYPRHDVTRERPQGWRAVREWLRRCFR